MPLPNPTHEAIYEITFADDGLTMFVLLKQMKSLVNSLEDEFEITFTGDERFEGWLGTWELESPVTHFDVVISASLNTKQRIKTFNDAYAVILNFVKKHWHDF
jgi:hypothetical protein